MPITSIFTSFFFPYDISSSFIDMILSGTQMMSFLMFSFGIIGFQKKLLSPSLLYCALIPLHFTIFPQTHVLFFSCSFLESVLSVWIWCLAKDPGGITLLLLHVFQCGLLPRAAAKIQFPGNPQEGLGISTEEAFFSTPMADFSGLNTLRTWKTNKEPLSEWLTSQQYFTYWDPASNVLCDEGFPLYFLLNFFLFFFWDSELSAWKHNWDLPL